MAAENVKVIVRCRPMNAREKVLKCKNIVFMDPEKCSCSITNASDFSAPPKGFAFDGVYDTTSTTEQIYNEIAYPLVEGVLEGYNSTVFAYGQTGCGKSFSMQGVCEPASQRGIIPRAFEHIFESIALASETKYLILASYLEIYNEEIRDLLSQDVRRRLELKESPDKGVYVGDLSYHAVSTVAECQTLMEQGWNNRSVGSTLMNADSSRSHSIFCISVEQMQVSGSCGMESEGPIRRGKLNLVDLAGSERQAKTGATGERLKEATKINLSLSALGNVISALVDGKAKHIPYRDSKLTRLLQDSLGGNTKTLMVACLSPADNNYDETLSTLRYANRAKNIANKPKINEDPKDTMLREYQEEIRQLRSLLESSGTIPPDRNSICLLSNDTDLSSTNVLEREKLRLEYESEMDKLRDQYNAERKSKYKMEADLQVLKEQYQRAMENLGNNNNSHLDSTGDSVPREDGPEFVNKKSQDVSAAQQEILKRLQRLQATMVGGERKNDRELREKKMKKKVAAEKRLKCLAQVLARVDNSEDDSGSNLVLGVYDDIQEELNNKIEALKKQKQKVKALDREIQDLQSEFELERTDYLETIRRHERQIQLHNQIFDRLVPIISKEYNYSNIERIKQEAVWSEDSHTWRTPELSSLHPKLPPTGSQAAYISASLETLAQSKRWKGSVGSGTSGSTSSPSVTNSSPESCPSRRGSSDLKFTRDEDIAENYFKPKRATELLRQHEAGKALDRWRDLTLKSNKLSPLQGDVTSLPSSFSTLRGSGRSNSVWQSSPSMVTNHWMNNTAAAPSPDLSMKKPLRLEALPDLKVPDKRRKGSLNLNKMDVL